MKKIRYFDANPLTPDNFPGFLRQVAESAREYRDAFGTPPTGHDPIDIGHGPLAGLLRWDVLHNGLKKMYGTLSALPPQEQAAYVRDRLAPLGLSSLDQVSGLPAFTSAMDIKRLHFTLSGLFRESAAFIEKEQREPGPDDVIAGHPVRRLDVYIKTYGVVGNDLNMIPKPRTIDDLLLTTGLVKYKGRDRVPVTGDRLRKLRDTFEETLIKRAEKQAANAAKPPRKKRKRRFIERRRQPG